MAVATILPKHYPRRPDLVPVFAAKGAEANPLIRAGRGVHFDALMDFAANPTIGDDDDARDLRVFKPDGVHPTGECGDNCGGQGYMMVIYRNAMDSALGLAQGTGG